MKRIVTGLVTFFLLMTSLPFTASSETDADKRPAARPRHVMERMRRPGLEMMIKRHQLVKHLRALNLTEDQQEAIHGIRTASVKSTLRKKVDLHIARLELRDMLRKDPVDMAAAEAKLKDIASLQTDLRLSRIKTWEQVKAQLTPEQRKELTAKIRAHRPFGMRERHGGTDGRLGKYPEMDEGITEGKNNHSSPEVSGALAPTPP